MAVLTFLAKVLISKDFITTMIDLSVKLCELNIRAKPIVLQKWPENTALITAMETMQQACEAFRLVAVPQKEREREQYRPAAEPPPVAPDTPTPPPDPE